MTDMKKDVKKLLSFFLIAFAVAGTAMAAPAPQKGHKPSKTDKVLHTVGTVARVLTGDMYVGYGYGQPTYRTHGYEVRPVNPMIRNGWNMPKPSSTRTVPPPPPSWPRPSSTRTVPTPPRGPRR